MMGKKRAWNRQREDLFVKEHGKANHREQKGKTWWKKSPAGVIRGERHEGKRRERGHSGERKRKKGFTGGEDSTGREGTTLSEGSKQKKVPPKAYSKKKGKTGQNQIGGKKRSVWNNQKKSVLIDTGKTKRRTGEVFQGSLERTSKFGEEGTKRSAQEATRQEGQKRMQKEKEEMTP